MTMKCESVLILHSDFVDLDQIPKHERFRYWKYGSEKCSHGKRLFSTRTVNLVTSRYED